MFALVLVALAQWRPSRIDVCVDGGGRRLCWRDGVGRRCRWRRWIDVVFGVIRDDYPPSRRHVGGGFCKTCGYALSKKGGMHVAMAPS